MTEDEARDWLRIECDVPRGTWGLLERFVTMLEQEAGRQNLVAASTLPHIWSRHIVDSAQLLRLTSHSRTSWLDLGSGAGFPGIIVAILADHDMTLVESRTKRVQFLRAVIEMLGLETKARVQASRVETMADAQFDIVSARAFAPLDKLFAAAVRLSHAETQWLLPKGRNAMTELEAARASWQGDFRIEPSLTDPDAAIIVARAVRPKGRR